MMAGCLENVIDLKPDWVKYKANLDEQNDEIEALKSFYESTDNLEVFEEAPKSENQKYSLQVHKKQTQGK